MSDNTSEEAARVANKGPGDDYEQDWEDASALLKQDVGQKSGEERAGVKRFDGVPGKTPPPAYRRDASKGPVAKRGSSAASMSDEETVLS